MFELTPCPPDHHITPDVDLNHDALRLVCQCGWVGEPTYYDELESLIRHHWKIPPTNLGEGDGTIESFLVQAGQLLGKDADQLTHEDLEMFLQWGRWDQEVHRIVLEATHLGYTTLIQHAPAQTLDEALEQMRAVRTAEDMVS